MSSISRKFVGLFAPRRLVLPFVVAGMASALSGPVAVSSPATCLEAFDVKRGDNCNASDSLSMRLRNRCAETIDAKYCLQRSNLSWDCGMDSGMKPGEQTSYFTCHSTGTYRLMQRSAGSSEKLPDPPPGNAGGGVPGPIIRE